ncbi:MAG: hypothetical protein PHR35_03885 [Kiritimatiellae bacterium]|nr:hypothetical protein [Kiritimatiellia bacterium]
MINPSFDFDPAPWIPFRDKRVLDNVRLIDTWKRVGRHFENPEFELRVVYDARNVFVTDLFHRIRLSDTANRRLVLLLPTPENPVYMSAAEVLNKYRVSCRNVHVFFFSEYANERGEVAPWKSPYSRAGQFMKHFHDRLDPALRMPLDQIHFFTTANVVGYSGMLDALGGAGVAYTSVNWSGGIGAIEPQGEFACDDMQQFVQQGSRLVTPMMETVAEDSLRGMFGCSGDLTNVPTRSASVGPRDIANARERVELQYRAACGGATSWQRVVSRVMLFGPVTTAVPASMLRLYRGICYVSSEVARLPEYDADNDPLAERF